PYAYHIVSYGENGGVSRPEGYLVEVTEPGAGAAGTADPIAEYSKFYDDLTGYGWAVYYIDFLTGRGLFRGEFAYNGYLFRPDEAMTNAAFADLAGGLWSENRAASDAALVAAGITGANGTLLAPDRPIARKTVCLFIAAALNLPPEKITELGEYEDVSALDDQTASAVAAAVKAGYIKGNGGKLLSEDCVTRSEAAVIAGRLLTRGAIEKTARDKEALQ
ncbi:MAG: S-layer homology domain-containing protein, partial [Clostridiales bacterium]|nr:S-layer homology domain-containing protein [Clostridiales bacterium]